VRFYLDNCGNSRANTCIQALTSWQRDGGALLLDRSQSGRARVRSGLQTRSEGLVTLNNYRPIVCPRGNDVSFKCLLYQLDGNLLGYRGCDG
jgi:hypothetical protein